MEEFSKIFDLIKPFGNRMENRKNEIRNMNIDIIVIQPQIENNNQNRIFDNIYTTVKRKSHTINVLIAKYDFI